MSHAGMLEAMSVRSRLSGDVAECVRVLEAVRATDGYPASWGAWMTQSSTTRHDGMS